MLKISKVFLLNLIAAYETPLIIASQHCEKAVALLLKKGAIANSKDINNNDITFFKYSF